MGQVDDAYFPMRSQRLVSRLEKNQWGTEVCREHVDNIQNAALRHWELPSCTRVQDTHPAEKKWKSRGQFKVWTQGKMVSLESRNGCGKRPHDGEPRHK